MLGGKCQMENIRGDKALFARTPGFENYAPLFAFANVCHTLPNPAAHAADHIRIVAFENECRSYRGKKKTFVCQRTIPADAKPQTLVLNLFTRRFLWKVRPPAACWCFLRTGSSSPARDSAALVASAPVAVDVAADKICLHNIERLRCPGSSQTLGAIPRFEESNLVSATVPLRNKPTRAT